MDLGLPSGTLWATCNIGANTPNDTGTYFAWGETIEKVDYDAYDYQFIAKGYEEDCEFTKYQIDDKKHDLCYDKAGDFIGDGIVKLLPEDDAANTLWGGGWHIPTLEEFEEMLRFCEAIEVESPTKGRRFRSKINGNEIFLPSGGYKGFYDFIDDAEEGCYYWASDIYQDNPDYTYANAYREDFKCMDQMLRWKGLLIRGVVHMNKNFIENPIGILRWIRHASCDTEEVNQTTLKDIRGNISLLEEVSIDSIREEFNLILTCEQPVKAMELLRTTDAMHYIIPEMEETYEMTQNQYHFGTVWEHTMKVVELLDSSDLHLRMAALLHDIGKIRTREVGEDGKVHFLGHDFMSGKIAKGILRRLGYPNRFIDQVFFLVAYHMRTKDWKDDLSRMKPKHLRKLQYACKDEATFNDLMKLVDADNKSHAEGYCLPSQIKLVLEENRKMMKEGSALFNYTLPITRDDVIRIKRISSDSAIKECLEYLLKLAYVNPRKDRDSWEKHLKGYHVNNI